MGVGKTTIGRKLAKALKTEFIDTDNLIVDEHGPIPAIFEDLGEPAFRKFEEEALEKARQVLAAQPEVVFIAGTESTKNPTSMLLGQGVARWLSDPRRLKLFNYSMAAMLILSLAPVLELAK